MHKVGIIGGGAAGLMAAITLKTAEPNLSVTVFERLDRVGKKIAVTGNGRCNISNRNISLDNYHGKNKSFAEYALSAFDVTKTQEFFKSIGVIFKEEAGGKLFPYSLQASSVTDALRFEAARLNIEILTEQCIEKIKPTEKGYILNGSHELNFDAVIVACGGIAGGKLGSELGYKLLGELSHSRTALEPAIVQVKTDNTCTRSLKGVKVISEVTVKSGGGKSYRDFGEVLFCDYGLSGPPIMQLSRHMKKGDRIFLDLMPEYSKSELTKMLTARANKFTSCGEFFCGMLQSRLGQTVLKICGFSINDTTNFSEKDINRIAETIKAMPFNFTDRMGFAAAQVTHGGINTNEFNDRTLMSKRHKGLFACGELLDIDGDCGGYNLQWAWSSGYVAALGCKQYLEGKQCCR